MSDLAVFSKRVLIAFVGVPGLAEIARLSPYAPEPFYSIALAVLGYLWVMFVFDSVE